MAIKVIYLIIVLGMSMIDKDLSNKLQWASLFGAVCVVFIHAGGGQLEEPLSSAWWVYHLLANGFCRWAVPFFFVASGFLLAQHIDEKGWCVAALKKRAKSLLVPYLAWTLIGSVVFVTLCIVANVMASRPVTTNFPSGWARLQFVGLYPYGNFHFVLWFVQTLMCFVVISPLFVAAAHRLKWFLPCVLLGLSYLGFPPMPYNLNPGWAMFFGSGIVARISPIRVSRFCIFLIPIGIAWIAWHKYGLALAHSEHFDVTPLPAVIMVAIGVWSMMPTRSLPNWLLGLSFPIYVIHPLLGKFIGLGFKYIWEPPAGAVRYLCVGLVMVVGSVCITRLIRRSNRLSLVLFGGR